MSNNLTKWDMGFVTSVLHITKGHKEIYAGISSDHKETLDNILNELGPYCEKLPQIIEMLKTNSERDWADEDAKKEFEHIYELLKLADE